MIQINFKISGCFAAWRRAGLIADGRAVVLVVIGSGVCRMLWDGLMVILGHVMRATFGDCWDRRLIVCGVLCVLLHGKKAHFTTY